jgi:hypothetical protein
MRKSLAFLALLFLPVSLFAQDVVANNTNSTPEVVKPSRDFLMVQFGYTNLASKPDSVKTKGFGHSLTVAVCYDFPIKKTHLSFAAGLGVTATAIYLNKQAFTTKDTGALGAATRVVPITDTAGYKRSKFGTAYLTAPFELRYFADNHNRNRGFKAAAGVQVGWLLGSDGKQVNSVDGSIVKDKTNSKRYVSTWNFAATARIGWGNFAIYGSYNLTTIFKDLQGPPLTPYTIGFAVTGL